MLDDNNPLPRQMIQIEICELINQKIQSVRTELISSNALHDSKLKALADEYEKSEERVAETKQELEKHLKEINNFRTQLSQQAITFTTSKEVQDIVKLGLADIKSDVKTMQVILIAVLGSIGTVFVGHLFGKV